MRKAILSGWEKYDPAIREAHLERQSANEGSSAPVSPSQTKAAPAVPPKATTAEGAVLILPAITVEGKTGKPREALPRLAIPAPARALPPEPFETPQVRRARLVRKHFTELEQALNRRVIPLLGVSLEARAASRESAESAARQLNDITDNLELAVALGLESEEEQKALRAELKRLHSGRPR